MSASRAGAAASGVTLLELKMRAQSELDQKARLAHLHHSTLTLVAHFLHTRGLHASLAALSKEAAVSLARETAADNVDLARLVGEWSEAEERKYGRKVKLTRKLAQGEEVERSGGGGGGGSDEVMKERERGKRKARMSYLPPIGAEVGAPSALPAAYRDSASEGRSSDREAAEEKTQLSRGRRNGMKSAPASSSALTAASPTAAAEKGKKRAGAATDTTPLAADFSLAGTTALSTRASNNPPHTAPDSTEDDTAAAAAAALHAMPRPIRTPPVFDGAYAEYASVIQRDILVHSPSTLFADIVGLHSAKQLLNEAVLLPCRFPHFFTGLLSPWKGVLLYGPPGTGQRLDSPTTMLVFDSIRSLIWCSLCRVVVSGKTMLARAVASECGTTFFNISSSSVTSKYRGDSEKLVRALFELARHHAPSTIFIDEVDSLMATRDGGGGGAQGDSDASRRMKSELLVQLDGLSQSTAQVFVLCASNLPWELDQALLRRLEKRILVGLPGHRQRRELVRRQLADRSAPNLRWDGLAERTRGWSGSDLVSLCKESAMRPVRRLMRQLMSRDTSADSPVDAAIVLEPVGEADVDAALACTRPSVGLRDLSRYDDWHREYGATVECEGVLAEDAEELTAGGEVVR